MRPVRPPRSAGDTREQGCDVGDTGLYSAVEDFPGGPVVKNPPANIGERGSIPGPGRFHMLRGN